MYFWVSLLNKTLVLYTSVCIYVRDTCILNLYLHCILTNLLNENPISAVQEIQANLIENPQFHSHFYDFCEFPRVIYSLGVLCQWILSSCVLSLSCINLDSRSQRIFWVQMDLLKIWSYSGQHTSLYHLRSSILPLSLFPLSTPCDPQILPFLSCRAFLLSHRVCSET